MVSQGLIVVGAGHGIGIFFLIEILSFRYLAKENFSFSFNAVDTDLLIVGFTTFLGQTVLIFSILHKKQKFKNISQIIGLSLLWLSVAYFTYDTTGDPYTHIALLTAIPFATCTIITFIGRFLKKFYNRLLEV